jgi:cobalt/nickel transport system permease protein
MELPAWLNQNDHCALPQSKTVRSKADYLEKTLADIQQMMAEDMHTANTAERNGFLQSLNPHVKLLGIVIILGVTGMTTSLQALCIIYAFSVVLAWQSRIGIRTCVLRVYLPTLLFTGISVLPGIISWITPGDALLVVYSRLSPTWGIFHLPPELTITKQGVKSALFVLLRVATSLSLVMLLVKTTRWTLLTKSLNIIGIPAIVTTVLDLTYRYLFLFLFLLVDYLLGRKSRCVANEPSWAKLNWIGGALAGFFRLALEYSQEITDAMLARGYNGENHTEIGLGVGMLDVCFMALVLLMCVVVWGGFHVNIII